MESTKWYEKIWLLILACVIFFPVGLYGVYKSQKITKNLKYTIFGFFAVVILIDVFRGKPNDVESKKVTIVEEDSITKINRLTEERDRQPQQCYSMAKQALKNSLNDRDSFEEDTHTANFINQLSKKDPYIQVIIRYRAKNGFGAMMLNETVFNFDKSLNLINTYNN